MPESGKPIRIFIVSSTTALGIAENLQHVLEKHLPDLKLRLRENDPSSDYNPFEVEEAKHNTKHGP